MARNPIRKTALASMLLVLVGCSDVQPLGEGSAPSRSGTSEIPLDPDHAVQGGNLVMGLSQEPDALDPSTGTSRAGRMVFESICEKLYDINAEGDIVPMLATDMPTFSNEGQTLNIPIRDDADFSDGTHLDAEAVKISLERHLENPISARSSDMGPIESIRVVGDYEIQIELDEPFSPLVASLSDRAGMILSPTALDELGDDFAQDPSCVGPFTLENRVPQTHIEVTADPNYYDAESVHLDTITYQIMPDNNIRAANLRSRDIHVTDTVSPQDFDSLLQEAGSPINGLILESLGFQGMTLNIANADGVGEEPGEIDTVIAQEPEVRRALSMAIDREALVDVVFNRWYEPACTGMSPISIYADDNAADCPEHDPEQALDILEEAGVDTPVEVNLTVQNDQDQLRYAQALQASVQDAGFQINIIPTEWTALLDAQQSGNFEAVLVGWGGMLDPHNNLHNYLATGSGNNYSGISDEELDGHLNDAARTVDHEERVSLYAKAVDRQKEINGIIFTYRLSNLGAAHESVAGVWFSPDGIFRVSRAAFIDPEIADQDVDLEDQYVG